MALVYPLKMYYSDFDHEVPNITDQRQIVEEYKTYMQEVHKQEHALDEGHITIVAMRSLISSLKQDAYFKGVRDIVRHLSLGLKKPDELFTSMFPDREDLVFLFKQQFFDACELLTTSEVDLTRLDIQLGDNKFNFEKFKTMLGVKEEQVGGKE